MLLPFLLLSGLSIFVLGGSALEYFQITDGNIFLNNRIFNSMGVVGSLFQIILTINAIVLLVLLVLSIPFGFLMRDLKGSLKRFGIELDPTELTGEKEDLYFDAAKNVFNDDPETIAFIYGHTHKPSIDKIDSRYIINTGTWLKQFDRVKSIFGFLPAVYVPFYRLNYFKIKEEANELIVEYVNIEKETAVELSQLQRMMIFRKKRNKRVRIPNKTVISVVS